MWGMSEITRRNSCRRFSSGKGTEQQVGQSEGCRVSAGAAGSFEYWEQSFC